ncbi:unnamed protein product [Polarella glacialis]|uniref:S1 motif domain-containing protein n=1 Tax=Polarella glacialis TaxID=89957 RepID=A0A813E5Z3_POLGL|nr:unnamed protein product [Polarella glacialis]
MRSRRRLLAKTLLVALALGACYAPDSLNFAGCSQVHGRTQQLVRPAVAAGAEGSVRKMEDLPTGEELTGTVKQVSTNGATLDLGAGMSGFLHVRTLGKGKVDKAADFFAVGDTLQVRVLGVRRGEVEVAPADFEAFKKRAPSDFAIGEELQGKVVGTSKDLVFVEIGAMITAILRPAAPAQALSELFQTGQALSVKVSRKTPTQLEVSMK